MKLLARVQRVVVAILFDTSGGIELDLGPRWRRPSTLVEHVSAASALLTTRHLNVEGCTENAAMASISPYEWIEEGKPYREWLVPAAVLNKVGQVKCADLG